MAYIVVVTSSNSSGARSSDELNRLRVAGGFRNSVAEAVGMYQKMVNQGSNSDEVSIRIFDHDTEQLVAMSVSDSESYRIESALVAEDSHYTESFPFTNLFKQGESLIFKSLEPKVW